MKKQREGKSRAAWPRNYPMRKRSRPPTTLSTTPVRLTQLKRRSRLFTGNCGINFRSDGAATWENSLTLRRCLFQNPLLQLFLTLNAVPRPGHGFQPFGINLFPAGDAFPEIAFANSSQRAFDHLQQLPVVITLVEKKFLGVGTGGAVRNVLRGVFICGATVLLRARHHAAQVLLPHFQSLSEILQLLFVHG